MSHKHILQATLKKTVPEKGAAVPGLMHKFSGGPVVVGGMLTWILYNIAPVGMPEIWSVETVLNGDMWSFDMASVSNPSIVFNLIEDAEKKLVDHYNGRLGEE